MSETKANNEENNRRVMVLQVTSPCIIMHCLVGVAYGLVCFGGRSSYSIINTMSASLTHDTISVITNIPFTI